MILQLQDMEVIGLVKPSVDVHTLGISTVSTLLRECGYTTILANQSVNDTLMNIEKINNISLFIKWLKDNNITRLGFSYRLGPIEGRDYFCKLYHLLSDYRMFKEQGGQLVCLFFAGLPDTCELVKQTMQKPELVMFKGDEAPVETLRMLGVPEYKLPKTLQQNNEYDNARWNFAKRFIADEVYKNVTPPDHYGYRTCGTNQDTFLSRLNYCRQRNSLPLIRVHAGPYNANRNEAVKEYISWARTLAESRLLDVLSIGSSQLTQSNFGDDWEGLSNGGGVPINSEAEYRLIREAAKPMLVRTYAGTKNVPEMAAMHERTLNIAWHALSFWWFCEIDGRGKNTVSENLKEHFETIRYIASTGKPLEPNVPHHFAFRGADDITYIISGYLAAKSAKKWGIQHLILQNMLNTPKYTWGKQDLAKGRTLLRLVRDLEDSDFQVSLQTRAGLDYFVADLDLAKVQLAAVTALMDDLEPDNENSPEIIHVVSYSEAIRLATPDVIKESIQITLAALREYRVQRKLGNVPDMRYDPDVCYRSESMYQEAQAAIRLLEKYIPNLYTPEGLATVFTEGFLPVPYLVDPDRKYPAATEALSAIKDGGVKIVDAKGDVVSTIDRFRRIIDRITE